MKIVLCISCAEKLGAKIEGNNKRDKCQCCGKKHWCTKWEVKADDKRG